MTVFLTLWATLATLAVGGLLVWLVPTRQAIANSSKITNALQTELDECRATGAKLNSYMAQLKAKNVEQSASIKDLKRDLAKYGEIDDAASFVRKCKSAARKLKQQIQTQREQLVEEDRQGQAAQEQRTRELDAAVENRRQQEQQLQARVRELSDELGELTDREQFAELGIYKRHYDYDTSAEYKAKMEECVKKQKEAAKIANTVSKEEQSAVICEAEWTIEGSAAKGKAMMKESVKLFLRAFNGECDASVAKVKHGNLPASEKRITRAFEAINKTGKTNQIRLTPHYLGLRIAELRLAHELALKKEEEKQREREIREQMREEAKAEKEIAKAMEKAQKEEELKQQALADARRQLAEEHGKHNDKLQALVEKLETELKGAIDRRAKATARAQLTKSGHVYVLSNVGSFGPGRYKLGMTRRFEPLERVKELGSASVPFLFDVHAMIYSENCPKLEADLHKWFDDRRVNMVNRRKEFFEVTLDEIAEAVRQLHGTITFVKDHPAVEYRETLAMRAPKQAHDKATA